MKRLLNRLNEQTGYVQRINPVASLMSVCLLATTTLAADEPIWSIEDGKILKDDIVFVESGIENPVGILPAKNGSVIVAQPNELTQIFDEDGDGKGDFFRALISGLPLNQFIVSGPMVSAAGEVFVAVDRAGEMVDLISWKPGQTTLALTLPKSARHLSVDANNVLAAIVTDNEGAWVAMAQLPKDSEDDSTSDTAPAEVAIPPSLSPAVRIPKALIGEGNSVSNLEFAEAGGFNVTLSNGNTFKVGAIPAEGRIQGAVIPAGKAAEAFAVQDIQLRTDSFSISLNQPIDRGVGGIDPIPFQILSRKLSDEVPLSPIPLQEAVVEPDGKTLNLIPQLLLPERVYVFDLSALKAENGDPLASEKAAYTVIKIPAPTVTPPLIDGPITDATKSSGPAEEVETTTEEEDDSAEKSE